MEVHTPLTTQTHANAHAGLDFEEYLKRILRHDPDVVFPAEIRDAGTVNAALRIVETGHQVFTTLHADGVFATFSRLFALIKDRRQEAAAILGENLSWIIHQRLVSTPCPSCSTRTPVADLNPSERDALALPADLKQVISLSEQGCEDCHFTGYQGRIVAPETLFLPRSARRTYPAF